jgi:hypothetical protein
LSGFFASTVAGKKRIGQVSLIKPLFLSVGWFFATVILMWLSAVTGAEHRTFRAIREIAPLLSGIERHGCPLASRPFTWVAQGLIQKRVQTINPAVTAARWARLTQAKPLTLYHLPMVSLPVGQDEKELVCKGWQGAMLLVTVFPIAACFTVEPMRCHALIIACEKRGQQCLKFLMGLPGHC